MLEKSRARSVSLRLVNDNLTISTYVTRATKENHENK